MCLILDTCYIDLFLQSDNVDMKPIRNWIKKKGGKLAYSPTEKIKREYKKLIRSEIFKGYMQAGKIKTIDKKAVEKEEKLLQSRELKSNDAHMIALALIGNVKLLATDDRELQSDFKDKEIVGGRVYKNKNHDRLLKPDICP